MLSLGIKYSMCDLICDFFVLEAQNCNMRHITTNVNDVSVLSFIIWPS